MISSINRVLGIQSRDNEKLLQLGPIFLLTGLAYMAGIVSVQSLFVSRFGVAYLPVMYLLEAGILPLQLWMFSYLSQKFSRGILIKVLYLIIMSGVLICALFILAMFLLDFQWRMFYPLLFIIVNVLLRILVPLMWTLAEGICLLQQAKRIFPILGAFFTLGAILAGILSYVLPVYFLGVSTDLLFLFVPVLLFACLFQWLQLITDYFLSESLEASNDHDASINTVIRSIFSSNFLRISLFSFILLLSLFYVLDYEFFMFMTDRFPSSDGVTQYFGLFTAVLYSISFLVGLFLNRIINGVGIGNTVFLMGVTACIVFAATGFLAQSPWALEFFSAGDLMMDVLSFTLLPPISQVLYKFLPVEQRAGASLFFAGSINAGGKLISAAITGLDSTGMITLTVLSIIGFLLASAYFFITCKQKHLYLSTLLSSLESHAVRPPELNEFSIGKLLDKGDVRPILVALQSGNAIREMIALEFCVHIKHKTLFTALQPVLSHPDPHHRLLAFQAISQYNEASVEMFSPALQDKEPEIRSAAVIQLKRILKNGPHLNELLGKMLYDSTPQVITETIIALQDSSDPVIQKQLTAQIQAMLAGDDENRFQVCRAIEETHASQYAPQIMTMLTPESSSRVRISAVKCLGALSCLEAIPLMLELYPNADLELRQNIESALMQMGCAAIPEISPSLDSKDIDIWYLGVLSLSSLDRNPELEIRLNQSCSQKLNGINSISNVPVLLGKEGFDDLADLYRLRLMEDYDHIREACWKTLTISIDPLITGRLKDILDGNPAGDKSEQAIELLSELSRRHTLITDMLRILYENPPVLAEQHMTCIHSLKNSMLAFPDPWLNRFANYAITHLEEGDSLNG
ncbi:MAG: HEAT repeat domain-containing protein [Syntrophomonas sp.]